MKLSHLVLVALTASLLCIGNAVGQDEKTKIANGVAFEKTLTKTERRQAVKKSLAWLEEWPPGTDDKTGWWAGGSAGERWNTFLAAQAFLASGSSPRAGKYKASLKRALNLLRKDSLTGESDGGCSNWLLATQACLLGDLLKVGVSRNHQELRKRGEKYIEFIASYQIPRGGWGHHPFSIEEHELEKTGAYPADLLALTNLMAYGLLSLQEVRLEVDPGVLESVVECYDKAQNQNGGIAYSSRNKGAEEPGRTAGTGYILHRMQPDDSLSEKQEEVAHLLGGIQKYLRVRWKEIGSGHGNMATMHLWFGALYSYAEGEEEFKAYRTSLFTEWLDEQAQDGSYAFRQEAGLSDFTVANKQGATSPALTALAAFVLQMQDEKAPCLKSLREGSGH
jgi:hypothetical protein